MSFKKLSVFLSITSVVVIAASFAQSKNTQVSIKQEVQTNQDVHTASHQHGNSVYYPIWENGEGLGEVSFETTHQNSEAQRLFIIGLKYLHSFEYQQAGYAFLEARKLEPSFAMAYWGQAMSHLHFMWYHYEFSEAEKILEEMNKAVDLNNVSDIERGFIESLKSYVLDKEHRELPADNPDSSLWTMRKQLEQLHQDFPEHVEAAVFAVYGRLATRHGTLDIPEAYATTAALVKIYKKYPKHPGVMHYILHSNENAFTAHLAKDSAENFAQVARTALHALHMPAHYYEAIGDWDNDIKINERSWAESKRRKADLRLDDASLEYHSTQYLHYAYMNAKRYDDAANLIREMSRTSPSAVRDDHMVLALSDYIMQMPEGDVNHQELFSIVSLTDNVGLMNRARYYFAQAYHAYFHHHNKEGLEKYVNLFNEEIVPKIANLHPYGRDHLSIMKDEMNALLIYSQGQDEEAFAVLKRAAEFEKDSFYEARVIKPPYELLGELLLKSGHPSDALEAFENTLIINKNRLGSLRGIQNALDAID